MIEQIKQQLNSEILKLPKEKQEAINNFNWVSGVENIGKKYSLTENEGNDLILETGLVLVGLVDLSLYSLNIENEVGITKKDAEKIALSVAQDVFIPISNKIESMIKNSLNSKNIPWIQTVNFIVSGGDYSFFIEK